MKKEIDFKDDINGLVGSIGILDYHSKHPYIFKKRGEEVARVFSDGSYNKVYEVEGYRYVFDNLEEFVKVFEDNPNLNTWLRSFIDM